ncbi:uncharacterized protein LOC118482111 isoform X2 [Helianthus annuus]|uniref:uncharacterized protein LOC118482111 isoform X2 n=1 Tax=Helianthus annuus TaxID=4232 RepID=UPI001652F662|nr:uncharacterized protein LOC118482111 isoform X2 [Helianthus annuus]
MIDGSGSSGFGLAQPAQVQSTAVNVGSRLSYGSDVGSVKDSQKDISAQQVGFNSVMFQLDLFWFVFGSTRFMLRSVLVWVLFGRQSHTSERSGLTGQCWSTLSQRPVNNSQTSQLGSTSQPRFDYGSTRFGYGSRLVRMGQLVSVRVSGQHVNWSNFSQRQSTVGSKAVNSGPGIL